MRNSSCLLASSSASCTANQDTRVKRFLSAPTCRHDSALCKQTRGPRPLCFCGGEPSTAVTVSGSSDRCTLRVAALSYTELQELIQHFERDTSLFTSGRDTFTNHSGIHFSASKAVHVLFYHVHLAKEILYAGLFVLSWHCSDVRKTRRASVGEGLLIGRQLFRAG